jgi:lipopolysaccharide/colanic/teichoic acid biosynthesis glycosyltransferase
MKSFAKRVFDLAVSLIALVVFLPFIFVSWLILMIDTSSDGFFFQKRVGQFGKLFTIYKLKTMHHQTGNVSKVGFFFRKYKLDELPQFLNVLKGEMSIVGPRPDIEGYYDKLEGEERKILELKPGITSEASIKYYNEEEILGKHENALEYNDKVIFTEKVNYDQNLLLDIKIIFKTIF